jgi:pyridinium-3,5-bisthiocarboxylic acid mononucleotide nickel chelatase
VVKRGISALDVTVAVEETNQPHRHFRDIEAMLLASGLSQPVKEMSLAIFRRLAEAEGKVHNKPAGDVHFHEVGAVDSIVDTVGVAAAIAAIGPDKIVCSPLHTGCGFVRCAHGELPVPAPATLELLRGAPVFSRGIEGELLTPTGAAILTTLAEFGPMPAMTVTASGNGAGKKDLAIPNMVRVIVGESGKEAADEPYRREQAVVLETNIDDMSPEIFGYVAEELFAAGAMDVTFIPVQMKKGRPGIMLSVLASPIKEAVLTEIIFRETSTLGIRRLQAEKMMLTRRHVTVETPYGPVRLKIGEAGGKILNAAPEYEDCRHLAKATGTPLKTIYASALKVEPDSDL